MTHFPKVLFCALATLILAPQPSFASNFFWTKLCRGKRGSPKTVPTLATSGALQDMEWSGLGDLIPPLIAWSKREEQRKLAAVDLPPLTTPKLSELRQSIPAALLEFDLNVMPTNAIYMAAAEDLTDFDVKEMFTYLEKPWMADPHGTSLKALGYKEKDAGLLATALSHHSERKVLELLENQHRILQLLFHYDDIHRSDYLIQAYLLLLKNYRTGLFNYDYTAMLRRNFENFLVIASFQSTSGIAEYFAAWFESPLLHVFVSDPNSYIVVNTLFDQVFADARVRQQIPNKEHVTFILDTMLLSYESKFGPQHKLNRDRPLRQAYSLAVHASDYFIACQETALGRRYFEHSERTRSVVHPN